MSNSFLPTIAALLLLTIPGSRLEAAPPLAITDVTVIDATAAAPRPGVTVIVRDGRIESVGPASAPPPPDARRMDGRGKFLIPGLWDMHVHLSWSGASALPILLANGVTAVRDLGGRLAEVDAWRARIEAGGIAGPPRIARVGPILNGQVFNPYQLLVAGPAEARGAVAALHHVGVDAIKIHRRTSREAYFAIVEEAKGLGIPVVGHVPMTVTPAEASDAGQASFEHTETLFEGTFGAGLAPGELPEAIARFRASAAAPELWAVLVRNRTVVVPTLVAYRSLLDLIRAARESSPPNRYVAASEWAAALERARAATPAEIDFVERTYAELLAVTRQMIQAGVTVLAGSDLAGPRTPGFGLHDELELLVEAGLTPAEALACATFAPAKFLAREAQLGTIAPGQLADLVLLDADPLASISNTRRISAVVAAGRLLQRDDLDALLAEGARLAAGE